MAYAGVQRLNGVIFSLDFLCLAYKLFYPPKLSFNFFAILAAAARAEYYYSSEAFPSFLNVTVFLLADSSSDAFVVPFFRIICFARSSKTSNPYIKNKLY